MKKCKLLALLLALLTLSGCAIAPILSNGAGAQAKNETLYETKIVKATTYADIFYLSPWEERTMDDRYATLVFEDREYIGAGELELPDGTEMPDPLGNVTLEGYDYYTEETYEIAATVYPIAGVDTRFALALAFEGGDELYIYRTHSYDAADLGELIDGLNLADNLTFGSIYQYGQINGNYRTIEFVGADADRLWELLFSDRTPTAIDDFDYPDVPSMSISVSAPLLGHSNKSLTVFESGYIWTNLVDTGIAFYIGEEAADRFMHYVQTECKGYELIYDFGDGGSDDQGSDPVLTTMTSKAQTPKPSEP